MRNWESALASAHLLHLLTCANCRTLAIGSELESSFPKNRALALGGGKDRAFRQSGRLGGPRPPEVYLRVGGSLAADVPGQRIADQAAPDGLIQGGSV